MMENERIIIRINAVGCSLTVIPDILNDIAKRFPGALVRQESHEWIIYEKIKSD